uniref:Ion_trans domain-containing protein n=1 Tax=Heterorhabditis bacteriophora TaxID=37862 RepID=A0A1I7XAJ6_HETBA
MNIGIRALMVIADGLQQKDEPPAMPKSMGRLVLLLFKCSIFYGFLHFIFCLQFQVGKPLMMTAIQRGKEPDELLGYFSNSDTLMSLHNCLLENSQAPPLYVLNYASVLHAVEGFALVRIITFSFIFKSNFSLRSQPRKIAISLLKEVKQIIVIIGLDNCDTPVITVLDEATPYIVEKYIEHVPLYERIGWNLDFTSVCDKIAAIETDNCLVNSDRGNEYLQWDPWACALSVVRLVNAIILSVILSTTRCPSAVASAWPTLYNRLNAVNGYVDPSNPQNESRASLLRGSKSKASSVCGEALSQEGCLSLWQKYLVLCCAFAPSPHNPNSLVSRSFSPTSSMETDVLRSVSSSLRVASRVPIAASLSQLLTKAAAMLRWENMTDIRDNVVLGFFKYKNLILFFIIGLSLVYRYILWEDISIITGPRGWGSEEATQLLLNNLMCLTVSLSVDHEKELAELWRALAVAFPANLPVILNYLYVVTVLSHEALLPHTKRICVMLAGAVGNRIAALLLEQLTTSADGSRLILERSEIPPYYRWKDDSGDGKKESSTDQNPSGEVIEEKSVEDASKDGVRLLPMPAYGGHYSALSSYLPPTTQPIQFFTRLVGRLLLSILLLLLIYSSQVALLLVCDIVRSSSDVDWTEATPRLLHSGVLNLDSLRPALCRHARQIVLAMHKIQANQNTLLIERLMGFYIYPSAQLTIINVCLLHADHTVLAQISSILLKNQMRRTTTDTSVSNDFRTLCGSLRDVTRGESPTFARLAAEEYRQMLLHSNALFSSHSDLLMAIVFCLSEKSAIWLNFFFHLCHCSLPFGLKLLCECPLLHLSDMQLDGVSRYWNIVSSLCQPPGAWIPSLISRLVETAGEPHEDTQAYVTDLLLCLLSSAPHLNPVIDAPPIPSASPSHARSTSYTPALLRQSVISQRIHQEKKDARLSLLVAEEEPWIGTALMRSKSADQLKTDPEGDEEATARMQICAIAVALLDSGIDNEFLLAINLLDKILDTAGSHKSRCLQKLEKTINQLDWKGFGGIIGLLSRGKVNLVIYYYVILFHTNFYSYFLQYCDNEVNKSDGAPLDHPFRNLSTMMSQYSSKTFTKDRFQWTKCVLQYLSDGIDAASINSMIVLLAEKVQIGPAPIQMVSANVNDPIYTIMECLSMLERSAPSIHIYVLHMIYLLVLRRDSNSPSVAINAQVVRSVSRHVQGSNWREAARVYKAIVEQWQNQERDKSADGVNVGFEFDFSTLSNGTCRTSPPSPRKTIDTVTTLKRPAPSHVRVRDRLVGLLSASGLRVGLPSATSVVFSQSELGSATSSTERICASSQVLLAIFFTLLYIMENFLLQEVASSTSLPDPSASITDSFPRVFKEFDFLEAEHDSVSETAESCFGWLSTMRPRSIGEGGDRNEDDGDEDEDSESAQACSEGGEASTSRMSRTSISSDRTPCPSEVDETEDEEEEADDAFDGLSHMEEVEAHDRISPHDRSSREALEKRTSRDLLNGVDEESVDGSSFCCRSRASVSVDYFQNKTLPVIIQCQHHLDGKVDSAWLSVVCDLADDSEGDLTAYATLIFTQLYRSCCGRVASLLRDAMHIFASRSLVRTFANAQDVLVKVADCPFLFVSAQFLRSSGCLPRFKLSLFELREHWETFNERKEQSIRVLNSVRSAYKLSALGGSTSSLNTNNEAELGKLLSKLFFQLMLMSDPLNDMIRLVQESSGAQAYSLSPAVLDHHRELLLCVADLPSDLQAGQPERSIDSLVLLMSNKRYTQALIAVRQLRQVFRLRLAWNGGYLTSGLFTELSRMDRVKWISLNSSDGRVILSIYYFLEQFTKSIYGAEFGCCETADIDVLLLLFCRSHTLKSWALVGAAIEDLSRQSQSLREANADLASAVRRMASETLTQRTPTVSSLTESFTKIPYHSDI